MADAKSETRDPDPSSDLGLILSRCPCVRKTLATAIRDRDRVTKCISNANKVRMGLGKQTIRSDLRRGSYCRERLCVYDGCLCYAENELSDACIVHIDEIGCSDRTKDFLRRAWELITEGSG